MFFKDFQKSIDKRNQYAIMFTKVSRKEEIKLANRTVIVKDIDLLIEKIVEKGFSYRQLAKKVGISQTTISLILKGERNPSPETAVKICEVLGCQFSNIFFINNAYKSKQNKEVRR